MKKLILIILLFAFHLSSFGQKGKVARADSIFTVVEQMPRFVGGDGEMMKYISTKMKFPNNITDLGIQGRVTIRFYIDVDGSVKEPQVIRSLHPMVDTVYVNVIKGMPNWEAGRHEGKAVKVYFTLPFLPHFK